MSQYLSPNERKFLNSLIHDDRTDWWKVIPDLGSRDECVNNLIQLGLINYCAYTGRLYPTEKGIRSNRKTRRLGLVQLHSMTIFSPEPASESEMNYEELSLLKQLVENPNSLKIRQKVKTHLKKIELSNSLSKKRRDYIKFKYEKLTKPNVVNLDFKYFTYEIGLLWCPDPYHFPNVQTSSIDFQETKNSIPKFKHKQIREMFSHLEKKDLACYNFFEDFIENSIEDHTKFKKFKQEISNFVEKLNTEELKYLTILISSY